MINNEWDLLESVRNFVKVNLNSQIIFLNSSYSDILQQIKSDNSHYTISGNLQDLPNHAFVNVGIAGNIISKNNRDDIISTSSIQVEVCIDNEKNEICYKKSMLYMNAVKLAILDYEASAKEADGLELLQLLPTPIPTNQGRGLMVSGVQFKVAIG